MDALLGLNHVTDPDGAVDAIAVTALNTSLGNWQYRLNGAGPWLNVDAALVNSATDELALLLGPTDRLLRGVDDVLARAGGRPGHIFNLGHGILPPTPLEHVQAVARYVHERTAQ